LTDLESIDAYLKDKDPVGVDLFRRFQKLVEQCGPSEVAARRTIVYWKRTPHLRGCMDRATAP